MDLKRLLCMLLTTVCQAVTAVEGAPSMAGATGPAKKVEAQKGVTAFLDGLVAGGVPFDRTHVEAVASLAIDLIVGLAHDLGAFVHATPVQGGA